MARQSANIHPHILEEATSWFVDFNEGEVDAAGRDRFNEWLRRSPEHVRAYLQTSAFWEEANLLGKRPNLDIETLIARAMTEHNIHPLSVAGGVRETSAPRFSLSASRWVRRPVAIAAALLVAFGVGTVAWFGSHSGSTFSTGIGEQRSITLEDGSSIELNSRSRLKVRFTGSRRNVELLAGQALFNVAKDPARPFVVITGDTRVRAVGTQFDVYLRRAGTVVTVVEGRVAVLSPLGSSPVRRQNRHSGAEVLVDAGEQITVASRATSIPTRANVEAAMAWTEKKLIFKSTPLREVVEEFNRYNRRQLVIRDPSLYDFHVSGAFPSTDSSRIVQLLRQRFGVVVDIDDDEIAISRGTGDSHAPL